MNDHELEALMRDYEAEVAAYKRLPQAEPTALLDRAILTKARAAVTHAPPVRSRPPRWMAMAASFAGVAIAAGIGWRVYEARQTAESVTSEAPQSREEVFEVEVLPRGSRDQEKGLEMAQLPAAPPPPAASQPQAFDMSAPAKQEMADATSPVLAEETAPPAQKSAMPDPHLRADHGGVASVPERRQNLAAPAAASASSVPMEAIGKVAESDEHKRAEVDALSSDSDASAKRKGDTLDPDTWLAHIRQLVRDRHYTEARTELFRFHQAHPEVVIPPDLRRYAP